MVRLTITARARADLQEIHSHIAKDNLGAARRFVERLRTKARQLAETPGIGRSRREDLRPDLFSFPVGRYILFYREQPSGSYSYALFTAAATCLRSLAALNPSGTS